MQSAEPPGSLETAVCGGKPSHPGGWLGIATDPDSMLTNLAATGHLAGTDRAWSTLTSP